MIGHMSLVHRCIPPRNLHCKTTCCYNFSRFGRGYNIAHFRVIEPFRSLIHRQLL